MDDGWQMAMQLRITFEHSGTSASTSASELSSCLPFDSASCFGLLFWLLALAFCFNFPLTPFTSASSCYLLLKSFLPPAKRRRQHQQDDGSYPHLRSPLPTRNHWMFFTWIATGKTNSKQKLRAIWTVDKRQTSHDTRWITNKTTSKIIGHCSHSEFVSARCPYFCLLIPAITSTFCSCYSSDFCFRLPPPLPTAFTRKQ